jgi:hypothetical protein
MRIRISNLEECVVCVHESQTQVSNGGLRFLNLKKVCQNWNQMVLKKFKELVSNLHLENLENFQIVRIETGVLFS